eukprot:TRINITY_DN8769_c0_g1_i1.p2 TRINITY_DN8769_c0_g1~~TRINITY_DN8769_c0_g1_i1.p2  ORF type:complete len:452 (+),score=107.60 TRINITY_DN8769_c0_g1_i1:34-1356(+)
MAATGDDEQQVVLKVTPSADEGDVAAPSSSSYASAAATSSPYSTTSSHGTRSPKRRGGWKSFSPTSQVKEKKHPKGFKLRVGQFNLLNMAKAGVDFYPNERYTQDEVASKIDWTAAQLKKMNAGIVGFEELIHEEVLLAAIEKSGLPKGELVSYPTGGPGVALYSIYRVVESDSIADFPPEAILTVNGFQMPLRTFSRPVLRVVIELPTTPPQLVTVFVLHLKSKRPSVDASRRHDQRAKACGHAVSLILRAAEAAAARCLLINEMINNSRPVIVLGDLNDVVHSVTTEIVAGTPPWKNLPREQKEKIWDTLLWSTNEVQVRASDRDVTYSHIHNGRYEVLDHIFVSQEFVKSNPEHIGYVQFLQIFNDHLVDETLCDPEDSFRVRMESDHGQVVAAIKIYNNEPRDPDPEAEENGETLSPRYRSSNRGNNHKQRASQKH